MTRDRDPQAQGGWTSPTVGDYLISSRGLSEYAGMFALTREDLTGRVLDCPGGGAAFTAQARLRGVHAVAADPVYAGDRAGLARRLRRELDRGAAWVRDRPAAYCWDAYGDIADHTRARAGSADRFLADLREHPGRYVAAALPHLPFAAASFDLVLSSHLLFTYADRLDETFHADALRELARVARREVRVYPLLDQAGAPLDDLVATLAEGLRADGFDARLRDVPYEFQRGARQCLVVASPARGRTPAAGPV